MLVDFTLRNFLSFKDEASLSMLAARSVKEHESCGDSETCNIINVPHSDSKVLKAAAIYGANGSGKSNLLYAMSFFKQMVLDSFRNDSILVGASEMSYKFSTESQEEPSSFEMMFIIGEIRYRYGFEIYKNSIESEWLFIKPLESVRESYCFKREKKKITINPKTFKGAGGITSKTRDSALFLSTCAQFNVAVSMIIKEWFRNRFNILSGLDDAIHYTANQFLRDQEMQKRIVEFVKIIDLGIDDIQVKEREINIVSEPVENMIRNISHKSNAMKSEFSDMNNVEILTAHKRYENGHLKDTLMTPFGIESLGTKKIFGLLGPWFDTILNGGTLIIDEFGASLHTHLSIELLKIFQSSINKDAQLIIATHDTNLLRGELLRRDQIWFTEKNKQGESDLYSLVEYKINQANSVRNDAAYNKNYLHGKYGAIPYFGNIKQFITDFLEDGK